MTLGPFAEGMKTLYKVNLLEYPFNESSNP